MNPPKGFCNNSFKKTRYGNEILVHCQWINEEYADFNKIENCSYVREGERSILGLYGLEKILKIHIVISLCDNPAHNRADKMTI